MIEQVLWMTADRIGRQDFSNLFQSGTELFGGWVRESLLGGIEGVLQLDVYPDDIHLLEEKGRISEERIGDDVVWGDMITIEPIMVEVRKTMVVDHF